MMAIILISCQQKDNRDPKPYKFPISWLDSLVDEKEAIVTFSFTPEGKVRTKKYFLADSVSYMLEYNKFNELSTAYKYNSNGLEIWQENYYPNGQRMARYTKKGISSNGLSYADGFYEAYYDMGEIKERGMYKNDKLVWMLPFTRDRVAGDTIYYQFTE